MHKCQVVFSSGKHFVICCSVYHLKNELRIDNNNYHYCPTRSSVIIYFAHSTYDFSIRTMFLEG